MKRLICLVFLSSTISGCATPVIIDNGSQSRVFTPCTNNDFCFRDTYNIAWDNSRSCCPDYGRSYCPDYPVSYRSKQSEYESNKVEYILLPNRVVTEQVGGVR